MSYTITSLNDPTQLTLIISTVSTVRLVPSLQQPYSDPYICPPLGNNIMHLRRSLIIISTIASMGLVKAECEDDITDMIRNPDYMMAVMQYFNACFGDNDEECDTSNFANVCIDAGGEFFIFGGKAQCDQGKFGFDQIAACLPVSCNRDEDILVDFFANSPANDGKYTGCSIAQIKFADQASKGSSQLSSTTSAGSISSLSLATASISLAMTGLAWFTLS